MTLRAHVSFDARPFLRTTGAIERRRRRLRPVLERFVDDFYDIEREMFKTRGKGRWRKDSKAWAAKKRRSGHDARELVFTGEGERSMTHRGARDAVLEYRQDRVVVGTRNVGLVMADSGRGRGHRKRQVIRLSPPYKREARAYPMQYMLTGRIPRRSGRR